MEFFCTYSLPHYQDEFQVQELSTVDAGLKGSYRALFQDFLTGDRCREQLAHIVVSLWAGIRKVFYCGLDRQVLVLVKPFGDFREFPVGNWGLRPDSSVWAKYYLPMVEQQRKRYGYMEQP